LMNSGMGLVLSCRMPKFCPEYLVLRNSYLTWKLHPVNTIL
jgi:hypothetical protein